MKRLALVVVVVSCSGRDKPIEHPIEQPPPAPSTTPAVAPAPTPAPRKLGPPVAAARPVRDTYHGVTVEDPYRWLEGSEPAVSEWTAGQTAYARKLLDGLPEVDALRSELAAIINAPITQYGGLRLAGTRYFAMRKQPNKEQAELIAFDDPAKAGEAKLVLDPTAAGNTHRTIDWFVPSQDGKLVAVSLSENGSENGSVHVLDADGKELDVVIPNVQRGTGGGSLAWTPDGKGFFYTRYPAAGEKPDAERDFWMQVWFHALGTQVDKDRYEIGKDFPKIAEIILDSDSRGRVLAKVQNGDGHEFRYYLREAKGAWRQLSDWKDGADWIGFGTTPDLWVVSTADAPRGKLMKLAATAKTVAQATVVVPQGNDAIVTQFADDLGAVDGGDRIYVTYQTGGPEELRAFTRTGKPAKAPALPPVASSGMPVVGKGAVIVDATSYTTPHAFYRFDPKTGATAIVEAMSPKPPVDLSNVEVVRESATSKDGTKVPYTVLWPKGAKRDGSVPCIASGYGGFSLSESPGFLATFAPMFARGLCVVRTNLRGGAEFGADWHRQGMLTQKQNVFDDFAAVLVSLVDRKYTRRDKLAIIGGSNGGLLMGAMIAQHPDLMKAVVSLVGLYDMVRMEQASNGEYNVTEYGTVKDKAQFDALYAYSPYHHLAPNTRYPAVLMAAGENDPRVPPWHSRKFTAALQAAQSGDAPILLRTSATAGHGIGTAASERINDGAQNFAFVLWQLR